MSRKTATLLLVPLLVALVHAAHAQHPEKVPLVAMLRVDNPADPRSRGLSEAFREGLRLIGYTEGKDLIVEYRYAEGKLDRLPGLAAEIVGLRPDVIVSQGTPATLAVRRSTGTIPIVVGGAGDLVGAGLVASLARPGGNVTGSTNIDPELSTKRLELLTEVIPGISRVAVLYHGGAGGDKEELKETQAAAGTLGIQLLPVQVQDPGKFQQAFLAIVEGHADALIIFHGSFTLTHRKAILALAAKHRLPTVCGEESWTEDGGLLSLGYDRHYQWQRAAVFVDKILKGARPADLPVEQPTRYNLVLNQKTAKTLGLRLPEKIVQRADKLIQ